MRNSVSRFLRRFETYNVLRSASSIVRGVMRAGHWTDVLDKGSETDRSEKSSPHSSNPLRAYFDATVNGKGIWKWSHYFDIYHRHLRKFVGQDVRIAEVGVYSGGSLGMWKAYFGTKCQVYGIDINEACKGYEDGTTKIFIGDQSDRDFWRRFRTAVPDIDIVIDDGGHMPEQQIVTLEETLPYIRPGG